MDIKRTLGFGLVITIILVIAQFFMMLAEDLVFLTKIIEFAFPFGLPIWFIIQYVIVTIMLFIVLEGEN